MGISHYQILQGHTSVKYIITSELRSYLLSALPVYSTVKKINIYNEKVEHYAQLNVGF